MNLEGYERSWGPILSFLLLHMVHYGTLKGTLWASRSVEEDLNCCLPPNNPHVCCRVLGPVPEQHSLCIVQLWPCWDFLLGLCLFFVKVCIKNKSCNLSLEFCRLQWEFNSHSEVLTCLVSRYTDVGLNHEPV